MLYLSNAPLSIQVIDYIDFLEYKRVKYMLFTRDKRV